MRIIAGTLRGRTLAYPPPGVLRPTMQRTREALFSSIGDELAGRPFLDLYAGAGGVGIEALSRGASVVHFVEKHAGAVRLLERNLVACEVDPARFSVHARPVESFLSPSALDGLEDVIAFADPPYETDAAANVLELFDRRSYPCLRLIVIEHRHPIDQAELINLVAVKAKRYGDARLSYFVPTGDPE